MRKAFVPILCLICASVGPISSTAAQSNNSATEAIKVVPGVDMNVLHVQVILGKLGFSPGVLDGKRGRSLVAALKGFQAARGLKTTGEMDRATLQALHPYRQWRPVKALVVSQSTSAGPWTSPMPKEPADQAKLPRLGYRNLVEKLSEQFHTTPDVLIALNGRDASVGAGARLLFPNALPLSRAYPETLKADWRQTLNDLNVSAEQPVAERVVVDKSEGVLKVYGAGDKLVAQFPATMGSEHDPLPIGRWTIKGAAYNPPFNYNPDLFWDADAGDKKVRLPPGPNGPVGVVWLDLSKEHYGIHGTPEPQTIGRAESHGCIRLTNWDAARLALMVKPGTPAVFQA